jgi:hypothetical protein
MQLSEPVAGTERYGRWGLNMTKLLCIFLWCLAAVPIVGQTSSPEYQVGTIMKVSPHHNSSGVQDAAVPQYEVSVKVGDNLFVVLYTQPSGGTGVQFAAGLQKLVLVGTDTITFNDTLGRSKVAPILQRQALPSQPAIDWSKAPSQYFSMKLQNLSDKLNLTQDQQAKIKPILSQEAGEAGQVIGNPVLSKEDQLNKVEKLVQSSDKKLRPFLSPDQWNTLLALRQDQKQELKTLTENERDNPPPK